MIKSNKVFLICIITAFFLVSGVLIAHAIGFVSYEPDATDLNKTKIIFWDNVRMINKGLKMSSLGINDLEDIDGGIVKIADRDLYVRHYMGFVCPNYPQSTPEFQAPCQVAIGDLGGSVFLKVDSLEGDDLTLTSGSGINLAGSSVNFNGKVILTDNKNLVVTDLARPANTKSVFTTNLRTNNITGNPDLTIANILFNEIADTDVGIKFEPQRIINISL